MSTNKHAIIRYRTIDRCLRNREETWNWQTLARACSDAILLATGSDVDLSERTIKGDLADMRNNEILGYYAPIDYDRKEKSYYYSNASFSISETPINKKDKASLSEAIKVLKQFSGFSEAFGIQSIITKLQHTVDYKVNEGPSTIHFDHPLDSPGQEWLYAVYQAISQKSVISIGYKPFGRKPATHILSPYLLKEYSKRWYLISYHHQKKMIRTYALDRITSIREGLKDFYQMDEFSGNRYFNDVIGVTVDNTQKKEAVRFEAYGVQVSYFKTRPIHSSQVLISEGENWALFQIELIINYELISELMSYRSNIKVLSPSTLVHEIKKDINKLKSMYTKD